MRQYQMTIRCPVEDRNALLRVQEEWAKRDPSRPPPSQSEVATYLLRLGLERMGLR